MEIETVQNTCLKSYQSIFAGHNWGLCKKCGNFHRHGGSWTVKSSKEKLVKMGQKVSNKITLLWQNPKYRQRQLETRRESGKFQNNSGRFQKGQIPHNKGKSSPWVIKTGKKRKGVPSRRKGEILSEFITAECDFCGKEIVRRKNEFEKNYYILCNRKCTFEWRKTLEWKKRQSERIHKAMEREGYKPAPYNFEFSEDLKEKIRSRDNYKCQECGCPQSESILRLPIHHIDYDKSNNRKDNLITLCKKCHSKTIFSRKKWTDYFKMIMEENLSFINQKRSIL